MADETNEIPYIITFAFLAGFILIRFLVFLAGSAETSFAGAAAMGEKPSAYFHIGSNIVLFGYHIHHFYFGFLLVSLAGWFSLSRIEYFSRRLLAVVYGFGLGLFMDEIGLLLTWGDYNSRLSYILSLLLVVIFLNIIFFHDFWRSFRVKFISSRFYGVINKTFLRADTFLSVADYLSDTTGKSLRTSLVFTGLVYLGLGGLVIFYPPLVRYAITAVFFFQGTEYLVEFFYLKGARTNESI